MAEEQTTPDITEIQQKIAAGTARMQELNSIIAVEEQLAKAHEQTSREHWIAFSNAKLEREALSKSLGHDQVIQATHQAANNARSAQVAAERQVADLKKKTDETEELNKSLAAKLLEVDKLKEEMTKTITKAGKAADAANVAAASVVSTNNTLPPIA